MPPEDETADLGSAQEQDDFASGFSDKPSAKATAKTAKPEPAAAPDKATAAAEDKPEYVQITAKEWAEQRAAAARTASYESQFSRVFGTLGNLQKLLNEQKTAGQTASATRKVEVADKDFADMDRDFPEFAQRLRAIISGMQVTGANDADESKFKELMADYAKERDAKKAKEDMEGLEDTYPDWRTIVGTPTLERAGPDLGTPYRKWLATKDAEYQTRITETDSPVVVQRSIALFRRETRVALKPPEKPRDNAARADRFKAAVQPKGDAAAPPPGNSDEDEFAAGFANARG